MSTDLLARDLHKLYQLHCRQTEVEMQYQKKMNDLLTPEQQAAMNQLTIDKTIAVQCIKEEIESLEKLLKSGVIKKGESVSTNHMQAVLMPGRVSWNTDKLDGYAVAHPEIKEFRKEGQPFVTIKFNKE